MSSEIIRNNIRIKVYDNRTLLGSAAAKTVADITCLLQKGQPEVNIIFAAAPSQNEFLDALSDLPLNWKRVNAFHMDEYIGLDDHSTQTFAHYLKKRLFEKTSFKAVHYLNGAATDLVAECRRYAALLKQFPTDVICMGIGENNHIAFNDPPVADFNDPEMVKIVSLDPDCRQQQVNDGCFLSLEDVPGQALTLTVPALLNCRYIFCMAPGERKAKAIYHTLDDPITEQYPSSILKRHPAVQLFLDKDSSKMLSL
jgi:glucosamine-6-phosphate deaminase